jgi:hypothetical protein
MVFHKGTRRPGFKTGDIVRIKSRDSISKSLDDKDILDGCLFTEQMTSFCGSSYKILKTVNAIFNEHRQRTFKTKSTLYILENVICDGRTADFPHKCDHSCFLLWHEKWLEKNQ